jgi:4,5-DOPA dioxygenase extradiol
MKRQHINPLFIGHGSPMNAISTNLYTDFLQRYAKTIVAPDVIIVISAHWQTEGTYLTGSPAPGQIYDFYGFPDELYRVEYTARGSVETATYLQNEHIGIRVDPGRGIDHAAWAVLRHMYPGQNIPVLELSLDIHKTEREHYKLGQRLSKYCGDGIMFLGSGNLVHNLGRISFKEDEQPFAWAVDADSWMKEKIVENNINDLINYKKSLKNYQQAIPPNEHYLPALYILGMQDEGTGINTIYEEIQNGSISMRSFEVTKK